jgi:glucose-6-phosphate isomerase
MSFENYTDNLLRYPDLGFSLDLSRMDIAPSFRKEMEGKVFKALADMKSLEGGAIANPDEGRMVGHYWLRKPELAPSDELRKQITEPLAALKNFAAKVHSGEIKAPGGSHFQNLLIIGIGGSALGPQLIEEALGAGSPVVTYFFDNTDPAGMDRTLEKIGTELDRTLALVISKSGGTPETRNGMLEAKAAYEAQGLEFGKHTVAITGEGSKLYKFGKEEGFLELFPMEDWVGGRTSVMSTVGLVPMALQGIDIDEILAGAAAMDEKTRQPEDNAALELALAWYHEGNGKGEKDMVVLPYKDSLMLMSKYLQQLVMESLGKELDLDGNVVNQGIAVYGNKGSTDQHAYVQQLRDGLKNFFATFIEVRKPRAGESIEVEEGVTSGDFLQGFLRGTRSALYENGRHSITISIPEVTPHTVGQLIALYERAVGYYAYLVNVNAYHQPGVEAGKKAAGVFLDLLKEVSAALGEQAATAKEIVEKLDGETDVEDVYHCLSHLAGSGKAVATLGANPSEDTFQNGG